MNTSVYQEAVRKQRTATVLAQNRIPPSPSEPTQATHEQTAQGYTSINAVYTTHTQQSQPSPQTIPPKTPLQTTPLTRPLIRPAVTPRPLQRPLPPHPTIPQVPQTTSFSNTIMQQWLADPGVQSVECPGPGKPIVIVKQNRPQVTSQTLDREAITAFLQEIATKTKIPLGEGLYKAITGPYIITAVISEIIGTRYIIQRR